MARKFKLRYLIISFLIIAVLTACSAFSVSYASWVGGGNNKLSTSLNMGGGNVNHSSNISYSRGTIDLDDDKYKDCLLVETKSKSLAQLTVKVNAGEKVALVILGNKIKKEYFTSIHDTVNRDSNNKDIEYSDIDNNVITQYNLNSNEITFLQSGCYEFTVYLSGDSNSGYDINSIELYRYALNHEAQGYKILDLTDPFPGVNNGIAYIIDGETKSIEFTKDNCADGRDGVNSNDYYFRILVEAGQEIYFKLGTNLVKCEDGKTGNDPGNFNISLDDDVECDKPTGKFTFKSDGLYLINAEMQGNYNYFNINGGSKDSNVYIDLTGKDPWIPKSQS